METRFYHTVNEGIYMLHGETGIFFDGIHGGSIYGYTDTTPEVLKACMNRQAPFDKLKALVFTHQHADHFDEAKIRQVLSATHAQFYAPDCDFNSIVPNIIDADSCHFKIDEVDLFAVKTIHDGNKELQLHPHVSYVINTPEDTFFLAGDALFRHDDSDKVEKFCSHLVDTAFFNAYQIMPFAGNHTFIQALDPGRIVLYHKPYKESDRFNIYRVFDTSIGQYPKNFPELVQPDFDSWID